MVMPNPIHPGGSPRDIIRQINMQKVASDFPKRQEVLVKLDSILAKSTYRSTSTGTSQLIPFVHVWVHEKSSDADIENIIKLFELNGATRGQTQGTMFIDDVEVHVLRNQRAYTLEE